jgi:hypothetical protein
MDFRPRLLGLLTLLLSSMVSTNSNEKHLACPNSPTLSMGIITARLIELEPEKVAGGGLPVTSTLKSLLSFPGMASCATIWDFLVMRQKVRSFVGSTPSSRGEHW